MHPSTPNRKTQTLVVSIIALVPFVYFCLATIGLRQRPNLWYQSFPMTFAVAVAVISLAVILALVWWKQSAAMPEIVVIPFIATLLCVSAWSTRSSFIRPTDSSTTGGPPVMNITDDIDGTEIWCNGVLLGQTPLTVSLESFYEKVQPVDEPPEQNAIVYGRNAGLSFRNVMWSATPYDPDEYDDRSRPESNSAITESFKGQKYWWTFRNGDFQSFARRLSRSGNANSQYVYLGKMKTLNKHVELLKLLTKHEGVDPFVAYADHLEKHPALKQAMTGKEDAQTAEQPDVRRLSQKGHRHSGANWAERLSGDAPDPDISFEEAVWKQDWLTIARSDNPKSVPLLKRMLKQARDRYRGSMLTFSSNTVLILMQSPHEEIKAIVRDVMASADWTDLKLIEYYIDQQLSSGADPNELTNQISKLKDRLHTHFETLAIRIGADNLSEHIGSVSDLTWIPNEIRQNPPEQFLKWLIDQWKNNRTADLARELSHHAGNQEIYAAVAATDLSSTQKANELRMIIDSSIRSEAMQQALSEAAAHALRSASEKKHIEALMWLFRSLPTETSLAALDSFEGPKNAKVEVATERVRDKVARNRKRYEADLQLAKDLIAGTKNPGDLVTTERFIWQDGQYVPQ